MLHSPVPDFPAEHPGVLALVSLDLGLDLRGGQLGLAAPQHPGPDAASLLVPGDHTALVISRSVRSRIVFKGADGEGIGFKDNYKLKIKILFLSGC